MYNPDKFKAVRTTPSQARGKERVRVILAAALQLFKEYGIEEVTTNDIAAQAHVPIGSLYRYYPNKDAIIVALTDLYVTDMGKIFQDIGKHPMLQYLSWDEVLLLMVDAWVNYSRMNGPFDFLYAEKASPRLAALNRTAWEQLFSAYTEVLKLRCPEITDRDLAVAYHLSIAATELGINEEYAKNIGRHIHHDAVGAVATYILRMCKRHKHDE